MPRSPLPKKANNQSRGTASTERGDARGAQRAGTADPGEQRDRHQEHGEDDAGRSRVLLVGLGDERHHAHDHERACGRAEDVREPRSGPPFGAPSQPRPASPPSGMSAPPERIDPAVAAVDRVWLSRCLAQAVGGGGGAEPPFAPPSAPGSSPASFAIR